MSKRRYCYEFTEHRQYKCCECGRTMHEPVSQLRALARFHGNGFFAAVVDATEWLIKEGHFNKEYLRNNHENNRIIKMSNYSGYIPEDLAKELLSFGMPLYDEGNSDLSNCDRYRIPTYGEVIDWFSSKGIHITFNAFFTFALSENVAYLWKISFIDRSNGDVKLKAISEEDAWDSKKGYGGSFELDANDAIKYAMNNLLFN